MRIRGAKTELEEAGESTDGMVESTAKLREEILALSGVDIMQDANTFKSTYAIMDELADKWEGLSDIAQATIIELIAGKHQGNVFSSLMANFDTARAALETSATSAGSAMQEHAKWSESLEARLLKLKATWQSLSQSFMSSDFLKGGLDAITGLVGVLDELINKIGTIPTITAAFAGFKILKTILPAIGKGGLKELGGVLGLLKTAFPDAAKGIKKLITSLREVDLAAGGAGNAFSGFLSLIMQHPYVAIAAAAIATLTGVLLHQKKEAEELAKEVNELTSKYKEQHDELYRLKGDYDTSNEDSMISKYEELSKGVDNLGRNVSLTSDEYSEYQSIVNSIADQIPSLVSGYDEQGNALLSCKDNVEELTTAYEKLIHAQNNDVLTKAGDIEENFKNTIEKQSGDHWWSEGHGFWAGLLNSGILNFGTKALPFMDYELKDDTIQGLQDLLEATSDSKKDRILSKLKSDRYSREEIRDALTGAGIDIGAFESPLDVLEETLEKDPQKIKNIVDSYYAQFDEVVEQQKTIAQAKLSEAFDVSNAISGLDYGNIGEDLQAIAYQTVNSLDKDFFDDLIKDGESVEGWTTELLDQLNSIGESDNAKIEAAFDLQTQFNGGEISYGEYVKNLRDVGATIDSLNLKGAAKKQLKLSLGLDDDGIVEQYNALLNRLTDSENYDFDITKGEARKFLNGLSSEEFAIAVDVITEMSDNGVIETIDDIRNAIERELALRGLTLELDIEVEKAKIESLSTAISESLSGSGLSSESISAIEDMFGGLSSYDPSKLFERTANGIHLNSGELRKLNSEYKDINIAKINKEMDSLGDIYNQTRKELYGLTYGTDEYKAKSADLSSIEAQINDLEKLAAGYRGLASAYQEWQMTESAGSQRDMYESIIEGFENIDDEISRGWYDDGTIEFLELLTGKDLSTAGIDKVKQAYKGLKDEIEGTGYTVRDFFTVNEDGDSTNTGVYNFLDAIGKLEEEKFGGKDVVQRNDNGNIIGFNFKTVGGDKVIAEALGVSEELVQIMVRAADDAGFVVSMDGTYQQLDVLKEKAQEAAESLNKILEGSGKKGFDFNFNTSDVEDIKTQLTEAQKILDTFRNTDGTVNTKLKGADEALTVASTLQSMLDKLTRPAYMDIEVSQVEDELQEPLRNLQEYRRLIETQNQLKLSGADTSELDTSIEESKEKILDDFEDIQENSPKLAAELDIDGLSREEIWKKVEAGEIKIPATIDIQLEMDEKLGILVDKALLDAGIIDEEEFKKRVKIYLDADVDSGDVEEETEGAVEDIVVDKNVEIIANTFGVEDVEWLASELDGLDDKTIQAIAEVLGQTDVDLLRHTMMLIEPVKVEAIARALGEGDVKGLKKAISSLSPKQVEAIAKALGFNDVDELNTAIEGMDGTTVQAIAQALGLDDVNGLKAAIRDMQGNTVYAEVNTDGQADKITSLQSAIDSLKGKVVNVIVNTINTIANGGKSKAGQRTGADPAGDGIGEVNGTANVNGTTGRAFKQGSWGIKNSGTALVGELGRETLVRDGHYYTIGDTGAEFIKYQRGDIIFNHKQTEELFKNGKVTSGGGRAKALVNGTALVNGVFGSNAASGVFGSGAGKKDGLFVSISGSTGSGSIEDEISNNKPKNPKKNPAAAAAAKEAKETIDWIETAIDRIERAIDKLDTKANSIYRSWSERNKNLVDEIDKVAEEIDLQQKAYDRYIQEAKSVGLGAAYAEKVRNGTIDIEGLNDEALIDKIQKYKEWYEKAIDCRDAIVDLKEKESELYAQRFENIQAQYDGILQGYEHTEAMLNEYISQAEEQGYIVSKKYYQALVNNEKSNIAELKKEQEELIAERDNAVAEGKITKSSEAWLEQCAAIDEVTQAIEEGSTAILEYARAMEEIDWSIFDLIQERISDVTEEADFLIELMSNKKLFDDDGKLTSQGLATMALHAQNYNTNMYAADTYGEEVAKLDAQIAKDPYDQELINRRNELLELQRESILAAEDEKNAIRDMVEEGIELELDALDERIQKYEEALDSQKDLYDYQRKVEESSKNISSLQKQLSSYEGFDDEETKAKVQQLKVELEEAEADLRETEYDKYLSDQTALLDTLYDEYELILNQRLDNVDYLLEQVIESINASAGADSTIASALGSEGAIAVAVSNNATSIKDTLTSEAKNVGVTLSSAMNNIWSTGEGNAKSVLTMYGEDFRTKSTTIITTLNGIKSSVNSMVSSLNKEATTKTKANKTTTSAKKNPTTTSSPKKTTKKSTSSGDGKPKIGDRVKYVSGQYYYDSQGKKPLGSHKKGEYVYITNINTKDWATHGYHISTGKKLGSGDLGWLKLNQISGYATGKNNFLNDEVAWTQEDWEKKGEEFIVRPSDGAILTPIAKGDSVLTSAASKNIWDMANSPAEFIRDNLNLSATGIPNNSTVQSNYTQHLDKVVFNFPNVKNYEEMLYAMQKDRNFESLIQSMTINPIAGKSSLGKGKSIR